ncbi:hypothetical protein NST07_11235 [Paenibacillus sp. FSL L8-0340]|uniref:hypothetical protein n=1 Tax=Paenibacillus sp. FSL L8-0340 TaxID=2954685 RepID=UPI0031583084
MTEMLHLHGFENQFVAYSGVTLDERYAVFYVSDAIYEEELTESGPFAGVLRYDLVNHTTEFVSYGHRSYILNHSDAGRWIYYAYLSWEGRTAVLAIHQLDCRSMHAKEVYILRLTDDLAENIEVSALKYTELYGLNQRYLLVAVRDLDPFSKKRNSGFTGYLLIDVELGQSFPVPERIGPNDRIVHLSYTSVFEQDHIEQLMLVTGRIGVSEKRAEWDYSQYDMPEGTAIQSVVMIPLEQFVQNIRNHLPIDETFIIDQCDPAHGYAGISRRGSSLFLCKQNFKENSSELCTYGLKDRQMERCGLEECYDTIYIGEDLNKFGIRTSEPLDQIYDLDSGELLYTASDQYTMVRMINAQCMLTRNFISEQETLLLQLIDIYTLQVIGAVTGRCASISYIPEAGVYLCSE